MEATEALGSNSRRSPVLLVTPFETKGFGDLFAGDCPSLSLVMHSMTLETTSHPTFPGIIRLGVRHPEQILECLINKRKKVESPCK